MIARHVMRIKSCIYESATEFPSASEVTTIWRYTNVYIIAYNAYAITMDNLRLLSSGIRLQRDRATPTV